MLKENYAYRGLYFEVPILSGRGKSYFPVIDDTQKISGNLAYLLNSYWDISCFNSEGSIPSILGKVKDPIVFSNVIEPVRILDLPIKFPGSLEVKIPDEVNQWDAEIKFCIDHFASVNSSFSDYFAYLTIDQSKVKPGSSQRNGGCHVDGFQGARIMPKNRINYSYLIVDSDPTLFYNQKFNVINLNDEFDDFLTLLICKQKKNVWSAKPYEIILMNAYCVHKSSISLNNHSRTFFRLTFEERIFDRLGNAHNPLFDYDWEMAPRNFHDKFKK